MNGGKLQIKQILIIFLVSLSLRVLMVAQMPYNIGSDDVLYHNIATNICLGNGISKDTSAPYEPYFWREPGYPMFLALLYSLPSSIGFHPRHIPRDISMGRDSYLAGDYEPMWEKLYAKLMQAILDSLTIIIIFAIISKYMHRKKAIILSLLITLITASLMEYVWLRRETLQLFMYTLLTYLLSRYKFKHKNSYLYSIAVICSFLVLVFQVNAVLTLFVAIYILIYSPKGVLKFRKVATMICIGLVLIAPWVYRSYVFADDIKVVKSLGVSLTHEQVSLIGSIGDALRAKVVSSDEFRNLYWENTAMLSQKDTFRYSFDGTFSARSDSLQQLMIAKQTNFGVDHPVTTISSKILKRIRNTITRSVDFKKNAKTAILSTIYLITGLLGLVSIFLYRRFLTPYIAVFVFHLAMFYLIASESRRMIFVHYYLAVMSSILVVDLLRKIWCRCCQFSGTHTKLRIVSYK